MNREKLVEFAQALVQHPSLSGIGEATDLNLNRGGRGRAEIHLATVGRPAHSSSPHLGRNAVLDMMKVIAAGEHVAYTGATLRADKFFPAWLFPENHPFVARSLAGLQAVGLQPAISAYHFCTNGAYRGGIAGVPTIGFGPAKESDAHVVDERLLLSDLFAAAQGY
ncbi:MAG: hypothetical protein DYG89_42405 [Caldilinea sp. CFX5]|nr:hypothetical protein [Caldilinea sp. CFX5]